MQFAAGNLVPTGCTPIATIYSGHQFGHYNPQLGDGRALLYGEAQQQNQHYEIQIKGAGSTPYSRQGDGRAVLRSSIREYLCSEAMIGLGIPSTRALALVGSNDAVYREEIETTALVTRLSPSHIRFGHLEYFFHTEQHALLKELIDYIIDHDYPELKSADQPYLALLTEIVKRTARLVALWQSVGFCHGVLNTDNMSVLGLTIDYGPFAFIDQYNPQYICNHSDYAGRYAFDQQPSIGLWNLNAFAHTFSPFLPHEALVEALGSYQTELIAVYSEKMRCKFGLVTKQNEDQGLIHSFLQLLQDNQLDYTNSFRQLNQFSKNTPNIILPEHFLNNASDQNTLAEWFLQYQQRLQKEVLTDAERHLLINQHNPKFILRNYLAQQAIDKAKAGDFLETNHLLFLLQSPYDEHNGNEAYTKEPPEWGRCMSISCSS